MGQRPGAPACFAGRGVSAQGRHAKTPYETPWRTGAFALQYAGEPSDRRYTTDDRE